jgi:Protein of unknown function (DUF3108)
MRRAFSRSAAFNLIVLAMAAGAFAQPGAERKKPFVVGETLTYEARASKIISGIPVADLKFTIDKAAATGNYVIHTEATSKGTLLRWFRYSFLQQYESVVDPATFRIIKTNKHDVQKDRVRDSVADFDYVNKLVTFTESDPQEPNRAPRRIASDLPGTMNDIISAIYALRMLPLAVGRSYDLPLSDSGLVFSIPVKVGARERVKTDIGRLWCLRLDPEVFGNDRLIEQKGRLTLWVTDDERHLPVRGRVETDAFKVEVWIRSIVNPPPPHA